MSRIDEVRKLREHYFSEDGLAEATKMAEEGMTLAEMAKKIGISRPTLFNWMKSNTEFNDAIRAGKKVADDCVEESLYSSCFGHIVEETTFEYNADEQLIHRIVKQKYIPPNVTAIQYWLSNRTEGRWKAKQQLEVIGTKQAPVYIINDLDVVQKPLAPFQEEEEENGEEIVQIPEKTEESEPLND